MPHNFTLVQKHNLPSLQIVLEVYQHQPTKAMHYHFSKDSDSENCFAVFFKTLPQDSMGAAHILEHTVLNGSRRFDVKNPFELILRRSLNSFINAFTASTWTAYPFATSNPKDFDNILQVYLDAAFFPNLDNNDFKQEGYRLEFAQAQNSDSDLHHKGVVYNEMKGAMSNADSFIFQKITSEIYRGTTYQFNSGGEPKDIVQIKHRDLLEFHNKFYHPSNAIFATYGNIKATEHQQRFQKLALHAFTQSDEQHTIENARRLTQQKFRFTYPLPAERKTIKSHKNILAFRLPEPTTATEALEYGLLSNVLLYDSNSPLSKTLEQSPYGSSKSSFTGILLDYKQPLFLCGVDDCRKNCSDSVAKEIFTCLEQFCNSTVDLKKIQSILQNMELKHRSTVSNSYPYGISLLVDCISEVLLGRDCAELLDLDTQIMNIHTKLQQPRYLQQLCQRLLVDNKQYAIFDFVGDHSLINASLQQENQQLQQIKDNLNQSQKKEICAHSQQLIDWQQREDNPQSLPQITVADIISDYSPYIEPVKKGRNCVYSVGSNGVSYLTLHTQLPPLTQSQFKLLPIYSCLLPQLGMGTNNYMQTADLVAALCSGISCNYNLESNKTLESDTATFSISTSCLNNNIIDTHNLLKQTLNTVRWDELKRIEQVLNKYISRSQNFLEQAHRLALLCAAREHSPLLAMRNAISGRDYIAALLHLQSQLEFPNFIAQLATQLQELHLSLMKNCWQFVAITDAVNAVTTDGEFQQVNSYDLPTIAPIARGKLRYWHINSEVNYCAKSIKLQRQTAKESCALKVISTLLTDNYLHYNLREKNGAYGGGAQFSPTDGVLNFFSYRDPHLEQTFEVFDKSLQWLLDFKLNQSHIDQGLIQIFAATDKATQPPELAANSYLKMYKKINLDKILLRRKLLLKLTVDDIKQVAEQFLQQIAEDHSSYSALGPKPPTNDFANFAAMDEQFSFQI